MPGLVVVFIACFFVGWVIDLLTQTVVGAITIMMVFIAKVISKLLALIIKKKTEG